MSFERKYKKSLDEQWCMRFETAHPDNDNYDGVITQIKSDYVVLREEYSFEFDGVIILPKRVIKKIRDGKYDKCCNEIIRCNGAIKKLHTPKWLDNCETIHQVVNELKRRKIWIAVEILFDKETNSALYLGPIINIIDSHFSIKCYDAAGKWEKEYQIDYDEIFRIEFDSKYCNHFNAFMKSKDDMQ